MDFFVKRPVFAMVVSITIVIIGLVMLGKLPISQYPEITPPEVEVRAVYPGANAVAVEHSLTTPLEQKVNGVEDMIYMRSVNAGDGSATLRVSFEVGTDLDMANVLTQNRVSEAMASLPEEAKRMGVTVKKSLSFPLMLVALRSPNNSFDSEFLTNYATINIIDALSRIRGVGQVSVFGGSDYAMRIWVKPDLLAKLGLTVPDITKALREQNVIAPAGKLGGEPAPPGTQFTYTVQTPERLRTPEEFGNVIIRSNPDGSQVHVRDIADVQLGSQNYNSRGRLNGADSAVMAIYQIPGSNALETATAIRAEMEALAKRFPGDVEYYVPLDTTLAVRAGIDEIVTTLWQAIILVILVVFVFLQSWRATLVLLLAIPVSLVGTFAVFPLLGFSINTISLLGLVLAIGTVVDDAIVVVESVSSHIAKGLSPHDATIRTMKEVTGPVIATSLALIAVFLPVGAMAGITGRLYQQFAITISVSVTLSSICALSLSPALSALLLRPREKTPANTWSSRAFNHFDRWLERAAGGYVKIASAFINSFKRTIIFLLVVVVGVVVAGRALPKGFIPEEDQGYFLVNVQLPDGASLQRSDQTARKIEELLAREEAIDSYTTVTGSSLLSQAFSTSNAVFFVSLRAWGERTSEQHVKSIIARLNESFPTTVQEAIVFAFGPPAIPGLGSGSGFSIMLQDRGGNTPQYLQDNAQRFIAKAIERPEIAGAFTSFRSSSPQVFASIEADRVLKYGVTMADVNTTLGAFLGGAYINDFNRFGRLYKVYVQAAPNYRLNPEDLGMLFVRGEHGQMVSLSTLIDMEKTSGPEFTNRFNLFRAAEVLGSPARGYSSLQALSALEEVAAEVLPADMTYAWNSMSYQEKSASGSASIVFVMALVFVYLILAAQYESWSLPISVLLGTPFAVFGTFGGLWLCRLFSESYENNVFAQIGLVLLIGLAAKNAILIVEFARVRRQEGLSPKDAALDAARSRFRPILMTAFSFILGVMPLLVATGAGAEARKVMGMGLFSGMLVATIVGINLVPALFVLVEQLTSRGREAGTSRPSAGGEL